MRGHGERLANASLGSRGPPRGGRSTAAASGARPLLGDGDAAATLTRLAAERHDAYAEVADARVDTAGRDPEAVVDAVLEAVGA